MAEPFKNLINAQTVRHAGAQLKRAWPGFDQSAFERAAARGLEGLEMKARAMQIAQALDMHLPPDFDRAAAIVERALAPLGESAAGEEAAGLSGWIVWSLGEFVARRVAAEPVHLQRGLQCLHALTQRFSAEFAIRPLLRDHPDEVWPVLMRWAEDPRPAVRRLASEGSRPRLPWGLRLQGLVDDPSPAWPLLARLQDDPDEVVRRSVANHLNDIAKDHPDALADWLERHLPGASAQRTALLRHASRSLVKAGHPRVMAAWGVGQRFSGSATLAVAPGHVQVGDDVLLSITLQASGRAAQTLVVDYAIQHAGARNERAPKVFKGWTVTLQAGETRELSRRHSLRPITTRRYHPGWHPVSLRVNGRTVAEAGFTLG
jgi:3-methyladenine DNA glycosylase AlkC